MSSLICSDPMTQTELSISSNTGWRLFESELDLGIRCDDQCLRRRRYLVSQCLASLAIASV